MHQTIPGGEALSLESLITPTAHGIASRVLAKAPGGSVTLFAFDAGEGLSEHTSPFEALIVVMDGTSTITVGGVPARATRGTLVRLPANVPHAIDAAEPARLLLMMLR